MAARPAAPAKILVNMVIFFLLKTLESSSVVKRIHRRRWHDIGRAAGTARRPGVNAALTVTRVRCDEQPSAQRSDQAVAISHKRVKAVEIARWPLVDRA